MTKTNTSEWIEAGLTLLREGGQDALNIARLCEELERTKGSFYHHFASIDAYRLALLEEWEQRNTHAPIAHAKGTPAGDARRAALSDAVRQLDGRLDLAVRAWGLRDPVAREHVARVDTLRIDYLADLLPGRTPRARRLLIARLEYAAFLGHQQLDPTSVHRDAKRVEKLLNQALTWLTRAP
ncbi:MAG: TetR family transcriptional regulator [Deltaproteobacteria bacterium]|nr:TetR family transcriptional regulator [Deltaproteobacteria bacterium]